MFRPEFDHAREPELPPRRFVETARGPASRRQRPTLEVFELRAAYLAPPRTLLALSCNQMIAVHPTFAMPQTVRMADLHAVRVST
jgi:hypothetical protein